MLILPIRAASIASSTRSSYLDDTAVCSILSRMGMTPRDLILRHIPHKHRKNAKGWLVFNAPCCHHRGHNADTRSRGNILFADDGSVVANCYNCGFKARYSGGDMGRNFENLLSWMGASREEIQSAKISILSQKINGSEQAMAAAPVFRPEDFPEASLPANSRALESWLSLDDPPEDALRCAAYLADRGRDIASGWTYHWSPSIKNDMNNRIIIPFLHRGKVIGWTGRYAGTPPKGTPRYFNSDLPPGYLFNAAVMDRRERKFCIIVEGPFDAIALDCVAVLGSELNQQQIAWLNSCDQEKIVLPDRQLRNQQLIDTAVEQGWNVSFPDWEDDIKDGADAVRRYGRLYALASAINARTKSQLQIGYKRQLMKG